MFHTKRCNPWIGCLLAACAALAGCAPKTNVTARGNLPARYAHLYMTVQEVWFNNSATASPDDTTWNKFPLGTPVTVDLAQSVSGVVSTITTGLSVPVGTYGQVRLIPVDSGAALLGSASAAGAVFNSEVDYYDSSGTLQRTPLELQNPDKGLGIATAITIASSTSSLFAGLGGTSTSSTTGTTSTLFGTPTTSSTSSNTSTTNDATSDVTGTAANVATGTTGILGSTSTTGLTTGTSTASTVNSVAPPVSVAINMDGETDVVPFGYSNVLGILLSPHMSAYDASKVGAIQGTLSLSALSGLSPASQSATVNIQVTAESLSTDGTRHVPVNSTTVNSDGTFTLYPLSTSSSSPTSYDLVIHGPNIATVIVKGVTVNLGSASSATSVGTITPRAATPFTVNLTTTTPLQAGAIVGFYQTLPLANEVPYLVEQAPIDPFNRNLAANEPLSSASIDYGTLSSGSVSLTQAVPSEGASTYRVAARAPLFSDGPLTTKVTGTGGASVLPVTLAPLSVASGAASNSAKLTVSSVASTTVKLNAGQLILSHDGAIVATADLSTVLANNGGTVSFTGLPGGTSSNSFASGLYYVSVRAWNASNPAGTLLRETYPTALDLRSGSVTSFSLSID